MAIDFGGVATTDNYSTAFVPKINEADKYLAMLGDPAYAAYTGTPFTGAKRLSVAGGWEMFNGTSWTAFTYPGAFTTLAASGAVSGTGFSTYLASPPSIGSTTPAAGAFTTLAASGAISGTGFSTYLASPPSIGSTTPAAGAFTTLAASGAISGAGFSTYLASPPSIGATTPAAGAFTTLSASSGLNVTGQVQGGSLRSLFGLGTSSFAAGAYFVQNEDGTNTRAYACGPNTVTYGAYSQYLALSNGTHIQAYSLDTTGMVVYLGLSVTGNLTVTGTFNSAKRAYTTANSIAFGATPTFDASASNFHTMGAMTANVTSVIISNAQEGQFLTIRFTQDGTGGRTITTGNMGATNAPSITGAPTTTANKASYLNITYNATAARWEGSWMATN